jgi:chemosensory pili system protein ChpA (sensor histidine kinase/response regulator)
VKAAGETFAVPMQSIAEVQRVDVPSDSQPEQLPWRGRCLPFHPLADLLRLCGSREEASPKRLVLMLKCGAETVAVAVDEILGGGREIVVKSLGTHLRRMPGLLGVTQLGDGSLVPILNADELLDDVADNSPVEPAKNFEPARSQRVMIVDDSVSVRKVTASLMRSVGWMPLEARNGVDALEILAGETTPPDLFLLDIEMPRMDGYELLSRLRKQPAHEQTPVIMVTSRSREKHRSKAMALGATAFLGKPYQEDALLQLIYDVLHPQPVNEWS